MKVKGNSPSRNTVCPRRRAFLQQVEELNKSEGKKKKKKKKEVGNKPSWNMLYPSGKAFTSPTGERIKNTKPRDMFETCFTQVGKPLFNMRKS